MTGNISDFKTGEPMVGVAVFVKDPMIGLLPTLMAIIRCASLPDDTSCTYKAWA